MNQKLVVILGPTSSGKSNLAIKLAKKFNGEIISADSRQVYKGMDIGTGKVPKDKIKKLRITDYGFNKEKNNSQFAIRNSEYYSAGIRHYLLDMVSPKKQFTVAEFRPLVNKAIEKIIAKNKLAFLVGGTPFYIYAVVDDLKIPEVSPNMALRKQLAKKTTAQLFQMLRKLDPRRAANIDQHNPVRLIRAIEIVKSTGQPVPMLEKGASAFPPPPTHGRGRLGGGGMILIGLNPGPKKLYKLINQRLEKRLKAGMVGEVKKLLKQGVTHKRLFELGLEYRFVSEYLKGRLTYKQMKEQLLASIYKFSKRQMTWFKEDSRILWVKSQNQAERLIKKYLSTT